MIYTGFQIKANLYNMTSCLYRKYQQGRLTVGGKCCIKECENEVGIRKFDSLIGRYELKLSPKNLITDQDDVNNLRVCNKHYSSLASRGHNPAKGKTQSKTQSDAYHGILKVNPCIVQCSQCKKKCLSFQ